LRQALTSALLGPAGQALTGVPKPTPEQPRQPGGARQGARRQGARRQGARRQRHDASGTGPAAIADLPGAADLEEAVFEAGSGTHRCSGPAATQ